MSPEQVVKVLDKQLANDSKIGLFSIIPKQSIISKSFLDFQVLLHIPQRSVLSSQ